ncbi:MAG TPA: hypothetical protein VF666_06785 [Pyrinomonadaceae bacterium]|jgi:hypothetical protein
MSSIILSSVIANKYRNGGNAWVVLNWALGLRRLGFDVYFVEQIYGRNCVDASGRVVDFRSSLNLEYFRQTTEAFGLATTSALIYEDGADVYGMSLHELLDVAEDAALLVNVTGHLNLDALMRRLRRKAYVDLDPGWTQFWHAAGEAGARLAGHDSYFTVGENIGTASCAIPTGDIHWRPTRQPVVLDEWPVSDVGERERFTTVASWRGAYGALEFGGVCYGLKAHEWRKFVEMPERVPHKFEIALDIHPDEILDRHLLREHGWRLVNPQETVPDAATFRRYVQNSAAEFSVAQGIYVETKSGWFSDRTVRYLASGKPALVQDTGWSRNYPTGVGLVAFETLEQATEGAREITRDYAEHAAAARRLAEEYFDSDKVLGRLIDETGVCP